LLKSMEGRGGGVAVSDQPILLCEKCGAELGRGGRCTGCGAGPGGLQPGGASRGGALKKGAVKKGGSAAGGNGGRPVRRPMDTSEQEFWDLLEGDK